MAKKEFSYREATEEIETILGKIESGEIDMDELPAAINRSATLLQLCKDKLFRTEQEVEKIIKDSVFDRE
jgi:exodeoxyribonuclease VII small subunit